MDDRNSVYMSYCTIYMCVCVFMSVVYIDKPYVKSEKKVKMHTYTISTSIWFHVNTFLKTRYPNISLKFVELKKSFRNYL